MRWCLAAALAFGALPGAARADMGAPGIRRIPRDSMIKIEAEHPGYQFWLSSGSRFEPLDLAPGRPVVAKWDLNQGANRSALVVGAPTGLMDAIAPAEFAKLSAEGRLSRGVVVSETIDLFESVPFYDSRERAVTRCRLEFVPGQHLRLVKLEENAGSRAVKGAWGLACVSVPVAILWGGWWAARRLRRALSAPDTGGRLET